MANPILGYPSEAAAVRAMRAQGLRREEVAQRLRIPLKRVSEVEIFSQHYAVKRRKIVISTWAAARLESAAAARGLSVPELGEQIIEAIARDGLVDAVLDDGGHL